MKIFGNRTVRLENSFPIFINRAEKSLIAKLRTFIFMTGITRNIFLLCIIFASLAGYGQDNYHVSGKVTDSKTKEPLAFVNIVINNSQYGGTTDIDGKFKLHSAMPVRKLQLSYVGYLPLSYPVGNKTENLSIQLTPTEIELSEVDILPGINPAHRIIRNAIEHRDENDPEKLSSFSYTSYDKTIFTAENDTAVFRKLNDSVPKKDQQPEVMVTVNIKDTAKKDSARRDSVDNVIKNILSKQYFFLMENVTKRKFLAPDRNYNQVIATRMSGFKNPIFVFLTTQIQSFSFYKPFITIFQNTYVNPISPGSLNKYFFKIEDTLYSGKDSVFVISYRPRKGTNFDGLKGVISISTNKWAIQNVIAQPYQNTGGISIKIQQLYELVDGEHWFPVQLNTDVKFRMIQVGKYAAIAKGRSYIRDIVLNPEMVRREFNHLDVEVDKAATDRSEEFWNQYRVDSLTSKDRETYHTIDSIGKKNNFDKMAKSLKTIVSGRIPYKFIDFDLSRIMGYDTYEGLILGLGIHTNDRLARWFKIGGFYQYSFAISTAKYGGDASFLINKRNDFTIQGGYFQDLVESGGTRFFDDYNSVLSGNFQPLLVRKLDRVENENLSLTIRARKYWLFNFGISRSLKLSTTSDLATTIGDAVILQNQFQFTDIIAGVKWAYKEKFIETIDDKISLGTNYPIVWLQYTHGIKNLLDGEFNYNRLDLKIRKTFMIRYLGKLTFQVNAGYVDQPLPACNLYYPDASYRPITLFAPNTFATMRMNEFLSSKYTSLYLYHDFGYLLFKGKKWFHPEFALSQNIGFGWLDHPEFYRYVNAVNEPYKTMNLGYYESGLLINKLVDLKLYTIGIGGFYRWGPYSFNRTWDNVAAKITVIFPLKFQ
jgi:hypothetical protein